MRHDARELNVAAIVPGFSAHEEETFIPAVSDTLRAMAASGAAVRVFTLRYPFRNDTYAWRGVPVESFGGWRRGTWLVPVLRALARAHRRHPFDLIHAFWATEPGVVGALAARRLGLPLVVSALGGEFVSLPGRAYGAQRQWWWRCLVPWVLRRAAVLITGSTRQGELARALCPGAAARWVVLPSGVPLDVFHPGVRSPEKGKAVRVLAVANLLPIKDPRLLLEVLRVLPSHVGLDLIGDGPERAAVLAAAARLGLGERFVLHGWIPYREISAYYRRADLFALTSWHEDQCAALQEALASGLPVVSTAVGIACDAVTEAVNGYLAPPGDALALAAALARLACDEALRARFGAASRAYAERCLDHARQVKRLVEVYRGTVEVGGSHLQTG